MSNKQTIEKFIEKTLDSAYSDYEKGLDMQENGNDAEALIKYTNAISLMSGLLEKNWLEDKSDLAQLYILRGNIYFSLNNNEKALSDYTSSNQILSASEGDSPENIIDLSETYFLMSSVYKNISCNDKAEDCLNECINKLTESFSLFNEDLWLDAANLLALSQCVLADIISASDSINSSALYINALNTLNEIKSKALPIDLELYEYIQKKVK